MKRPLNLAELFPMPNSSGASFESGSKQAATQSARLLGSSRSLPSAKPTGGMSLLTVRTSKR